MKLQIIPKLPPPQIPEKPNKPTISKYPVTIIVTPEQSAYWQEACDDWHVWGSSTDETKSDWKDQYGGLTDRDACNWGVYGHTVQDSLTVELIWARTAQYVQDLESYIEMLKKMMYSRYKITNDSWDELSEINDSE